MPPRCSPGSATTPVRLSSAHDGSSVRCGQSVPRRARVRRGVRGVDGATRPGHHAAVQPRAGIGGAHGRHGRDRVRARARARRTPASAEGPATPGRGPRPAHVLVRSTASSRARVGSSPLTRQAAPVGSAGQQFALPRRDLVAQAGPVDSTTIVQVKAAASAVVPALGRSFDPEVVYLNAASLPPPAPRRSLVALEAKGSCHGLRPPSGSLRAGLLGFLKSTAAQPMGC